MKVLIVEDVTETRRWLIEIVKLAFPDALITTADTLRLAKTLASSIQELALIDLGLPDGSGIDLIHHLKASHRDTICVVTTVMGDDISIVNALSAGADGYILKENPSSLIVQQLLQIQTGLPALSPTIAKRIMEHFGRTGPLEHQNTSLTGRETEVLALIARGLRNVEVATDLKLAETTVASYIKSIYRKLGISSRAEASWHATRMGLNSSASTQRSNKKNTVD